jgi:hypothetical protein
VGEAVKGNGRVQKTSLWKEGRCVGTMFGEVVSDPVGGREDEYREIIAVDEQGAVHVSVIDSRANSASKISLILLRRERCRGEIERGIVSGDRTRFILILYDGTVEVWNRRGKLQFTAVGENCDGVRCHRTGVLNSGVSPNDNAIVVGAWNGMVWVWNADGSLRCRFIAEHGHSDPVFDFAVDPLGEMLMVGLRQKAALWNWSGKRLGDLAVGGYKVHCVRFSPKGSFLVTVCTEDNKGGVGLKFWGRDGRLHATITEPWLYRIPELLFDLDDKFVVLQLMDRLVVINGLGDVMDEIRGPRGVEVRDASVSSDGEWVMGLFSDRIIRIWSYKERRRIKTLPVSSRGPIACSADRAVLWTAAFDVGQAALHAVVLEGELLVIEAEQVQDRRVEGRRADECPRTARWPSSSVTPWLTPRFTPAPVSQQVKPSGLWSRPCAPFWKNGIRPNSVHQTTSVSSSNPRWRRSRMSAAAG